VRPGLIVRMISKSYEKGSLFKKKGLVTDVPDPYTATIRFETGIYQCTENILETVIPKKTGAIIYAVSGKHRGKQGRMIKREKAKQQVILQNEE